MTTTKTKSTAATVDVTAARRKLARLRDALQQADKLLVDYWLSDEWRAFGHGTWRAFVEAELPDLRLLSFRDTDARDDKLRELVRDHGMSQGAAADSLGVGKATASRALQGVDLGATVKASDGRTMAARQQPATRRKRKRVVPLTDQVVALLMERGPLDVLAITAGVRGADRSMISPTLTRLHDAGRVEYLAPERRGQFGRYGTAGE